MPYTLLSFVLLLQTPAIERGAYGVPFIRANTPYEAWKAAGFAVAQDRMWQMENSRRVARGRMAEAFGAKYVASDKEVLSTGYTDEELQQQFDALPPENQEAFKGYADGVNEFIRAGQLPKQYEQMGLSPKPWTPIDSVAISVRLLQQFGRGGAGEIRNMALISYLQTQAKTKDKVFDVFDDFAWQNDPSSPTTVQKEDEQGPHPSFVAPTRQQTLAHWNKLPKLSLFELLPAVNIVEREASTRVAMSAAVPFKTGSYCAVVSPKRSSTGRALLLSAPQMGFRTPSICHEISIQAPGMDVQGMDVPGVPGVIIGHTDRITWGLTTGVADTDDVIFAKQPDANSYLDGNSVRQLVTLKRELPVKGGATQTIIQKRTVDGPVILSARNTVFSNKTSYFMKELQTFVAISGLWKAKNAAEVSTTLRHATMNFNVFYATMDGDIGYQYAGLVPMRAPGLDPRFPTPAGSEFAWKGFIPFEQMPHVLNPKGGLITNWNNKPVSWWPNFDTPVWGRIFRVSELTRTLQKPKLNAQDLEFGAWSIARTDEDWPFFAPLIESKDEGIAGFDGRLVDGSRQASTFLRFMNNLRKELFMPTTGNFASPDNFRLVAQPSVMLAALEGKTKFNYLQGRKAKDIVAKALADALSQPGRFVPGSIQVPDQVPIPYSNRGTYIQIIEMLAGGPSGRNVLPPGVAESGPHAFDQVPLSRAWTFKPMPPLK